MTLYVSSLRFPSLGTESIGLTILHNSHLFCLTSGVCLAPHFKKSTLPDGRINLEDILHNDGFTAEVTNVRRLVHKAPRPVQNFEQTNERFMIQSDGEEEKVKLDLLENESFQILDKVHLTNDNGINSLSSSCDGGTCQIGNLPYIGIDDLETRVDNRSIKKSNTEIFGFSEDILVKPCHFHTTPGVEQTLRRIFKTQDFKMGDFESEENEFFIQLASTVVVFGTSQNDLRSMLRVLRSSSSPLIPGAPVWVLSNPFSLESLRYCWSTGVLSSILNKSSVFLTDASVTPCSEGSPVLSYDGRLMGILICSVFRNQSEVINFSLGMSLQGLWGDLATPSLDCPRMSNRNNNSMSRQVVLVRSGASWGSGVVLDADAGVLLTCAHVIGTEEDVVINYLDKSYSASVVFKSDVGPYDLALLSTQCELTGSVAVELNPRRPQLGSRVTCAGYPVFNEYALSPLTATLSSGIISKLYQISNSDNSSRTGSRESTPQLHTSNVSHNNGMQLKALKSQLLSRELHKYIPSQFSGNQPTKSKNSTLTPPSGNGFELSPVMIQSNCTVHSGASGGALFDTRGLLVGLVVCNVKADSVVYPRLNMAVPICAIYATLTSYLTTKDPITLRELSVSDPRIQRVWNLEPLRCKL